MLRMHVMDKLDKWEDYLHLVKFTYNNNFQVSAGISPFEILYGDVSVILQFNGAIQLIE